MDELKVGDVVVLNYEDRIKMTVLWVEKVYSVVEVSCTYFNSQKYTFDTIKLPIETLTKVG